LIQGATLADVEVVLRMHPRDLATCIDWWDERRADRERVERRAGRG
jgi:hypothetical protein